MHIWGLGIQMLSCYFGMWRSATFSSAVWKKTHQASSPQIAFLQPPHHKCVLDFGCSSHVRVAFGLDGCRVSAGCKCSREDGKQRAEGEGDKVAPDSQAEK